MEYVDIPSVLLGTKIAGEPQQSKTLTLGAATPQTVEPDSGKVLSSVSVELDTSVIKAENIKKDVQMLGITGTHEGGSYERRDVERSFLSASPVAGGESVADLSGAVVKAIRGNTVVDNGSLLHFTGTGIAAKKDGAAVGSVDLPIAEYFPDGMKSAGNASDKLVAAKATQTVKKIKISDLDWKYLSTYEHSFFYAPVEDRKGRTTNVLYIKMAKYDPYSHDGLALQTFGNYAPDMSYGGGSTDNRIYIRDDRYTTKAELIEGMGDEEILYELAEPVETLIDPPLVLSYVVASGGTEEIVQPAGTPPTSSPIDATVTYTVEAEETP